MKYRCVFCEESFSEPYQTHLCRDRIYEPCNVPMRAVHDDACRKMPLNSMGGAFECSCGFQADAAGKPTAAAGGGSVERVEQA